MFEMTWPAAERSLTAGLAVVEFAVESQPQARAAVEFAVESQPQARAAVA